MHIAALFLNNEIRTGGHRRLLELLEDLAAKGNTVTVILNEDLAYTPESFIDVRLPCSYRRRSILPVSLSFRIALGRYRKLLDEKLKGADVLMIHGETHLSAALFLKRRFGVPILYAHRSNTVRETLISLKDPSIKTSARIACVFAMLHYARYERKIARNCDALVFQSPFDMNDFLSRNGRSHSKTHVIRGNIGVPRFRPETADTNHSTSLSKILFLGTLGNRKGVRHLLSAMEMLQTSGARPLELDILGPGILQPQWEKWIRKAGNSDRIRLHGKVADPFPFLATADLLVVPSDFDSYPDTVLEALHVGIPVIGSTAGGIPDMLKYQELLFPVQDPAAIASILSLASKNRDHYLKLRELCRGRREAFIFDWAAEWEKVIRTLING
jgi:glycosyltransferase involved in cell wall biosynthesis